MFERDMRLFCFRTLKTVYINLNAEREAEESKSNDDGGNSGSDDKKNPSQTHKTTWLHN